ATAIDAAANGQSDQNARSRLARALAANAGPAREPALRRLAEAVPQKYSRFCGPTARAFRFDSERLHRHCYRQIVAGRPCTIFLANGDLVAHSCGRDRPRDRGWCADEKSHGNLDYNGPCGRRRDHRARRRLESPPESTARLRTTSEPETQ